MSPHYLVKCTTFSSDWRYVAFLQTFAALKKSQLWVDIGGSEKNRLWCVANGMPGKQRYSKCSKWPPAARIHASSLFWHWSSASSRRPPRWAKIQLMWQRFCRTATHLYHGLVLDTRDKMKKMKNLCILQGSVVTFLGVVSKGVTVFFLWDSTNNLKYVWIILLKNDFWIS